MSPDAKEHIRDTTACTAHLGLVEDGGQGVGGQRAWEGGGGRGGGKGRKRGTKQAAEVPSKDQVFLARPRGKGVAGAKRVNFILMVAHCSGGSLH